MGSTLILKPRTNINRGPKRGISDPTKRTNILHEFKSKSLEPQIELVFGNYITIGGSCRVSFVFVRRSDFWTVFCHSFKCRSSGGDAQRWWVHANSTCCNQIHLNFLQPQAVLTPRLQEPPCEILIHLMVTHLFPDNLMRTITLWCTITQHLFTIFRAKGRDFHVLTLANNTM